MGAAFNMRTFTGTQDSITKQFDKVQEDDRYANGHSYSGGFGMAAGLSFTDEVFDTEDQAEKWLVENAQKWEAALAVKLRSEFDNTWVVGAWCSC